MPTLSQAIESPGAARRRLRALARLARQGMGFTMVGGLQLLLDWGVLVGLSALGVPMAPANVLGRLSGAMLGFWGNGQFTFRGGRHPRSRQLRRFVVLWCILTVVSTAALEVVATARGESLAWLLKPLVEGVLALISFFTCRHWVYGHRSD